MKIYNIFFTIFFTLLFCTNSCFAADYSKSSQVDFLKNTINEIKSQLLSAQDEIAKLQEDNYNLKQSLEQKQKSLETLNLYKTSFEEILQSKNNEITALNEKIKKIEQTNANNASIARNNYLKEISNLKNQYEQEKQTILKDKEAALTAKNSEILTLKQQLALNRQEITKLENKITSLNDELSRTKQNLVALENSHSEQRASLQDNLALWQSKAQFLEKQLNQAKVSIKNAQTSSSESINDIAMKYVKEYSAKEPIYHISLAKAYQEQSNPTKAAEQFEKALSLNPNQHSIYKDLGLTYAEAGLYNKSIENFEKYLQYANNPEEIILIRNFVRKLRTNIQKTPDY